MGKRSAGTARWLSRRPSPTPARHHGGRGGVLGGSGDGCMGGNGAEGGGGAEGGVEGGTGGLGGIGGLGGT